LELLPFLEACSIPVSLPEFPEPSVEKTPRSMLFCPTRTHSPKLLLDDPTHLTVVKLNHESFMMTSEIISGNEIFFWGALTLSLLHNSSRKIGG
jgi:hypothetical protein